MQKRTENSTRAGESYLVCKRCFDACASAIALLLTLPLMALICVAIWLESPGAAIYIHERVGENGKPLPLYKFRTMYRDADSKLSGFTSEQMQEWLDYRKLKDDPRVTKVGNFLRKSSLDELPQLLNILKGELSFVGPRPITEEELEKYGSRKAEFLSVTPGLTGYWQAYARNTCSYDERMKMELHYIRNAGPLFDLRILFKTVGVVISGKGAM